MTGVRQQPVCMAARSVPLLSLIHILRRRIRAILGGPLRLAALPDVPGTFQHLFSGAARLGCGIVLFGLPAGNIDALAGGLVIQRQAVAGHVLRHLIAGF